MLLKKSSGILPVSQGMWNDRIAVTGEVSIAAVIRHCLPLAGEIAEKRCRHGRGSTLGTWIALARSPSELQRNRKHGQIDPAPRRVFL